MIRLKELDNLRGFAALNVVLYHYTARFREIYDHSYPAKYDWHYGKYGVELFFVISGFVIFMTLHKVESINEFASKRFLRLYPTYWICILITLAATSIFQPSKFESYTIYQVLVNFTMIQEIFKVYSIDGVYWSLLPELFFYVFIGFFYAIGWLSRVRTIAILWFTLMILNKLDLLPFGAYFLNLEYGMFFLAGMLFYKLKFDKGNWIEHLMICTCLLIGYWTHQSVGSLYVFLVIFTLFYLFIYDKLKVVSCKPLMFLGYISYPLYLLHQNIGSYIMNTLESYNIQEYIVIIITICLLIILAWAVTRYIEKPILKYLRGGRHRQQISKKNLSEPVAKKGVSAFQK